MTRVFVNEATTIDFSYFHPKRGLLGETLIIDLSVQGKPDSHGMVLDFSTIKRTLKHRIDQLVDHKLLAPSLSKHLNIHTRGMGRIELTWFADSVGTICQTSPIEAVCLIPCEEITPEQISQFLVNQLKPALPDNVQDVLIGLRPEAIEGPYYHYSHGLKTHEGNCQRIAHGHRSKIEIYSNGCFQSNLSAAWAEKFRDIYIGHDEDVIDTESNYSQIGFKYQAPQGLFELSMPKTHVYLMEQTTTVEHICAHIQDIVCNRSPGQHFEVHAYEGHRKGAICEGTMCEEKKENLSDNKGESEGESKP